MAETSVEKRLQTPREPDYIEIHENLAKRLKKEPGAVTGKSVVVFKSTDVTSNNKFVFMPNTIEMAQIKKADKGQFKTNVQISSKMTEKDIQKALEETFPILRHQRFYCAAAVDNRSRLDFHGERRIWDGHSIKRRIKGNSALYILMEETQQHDELDTKESEPSTLKRSHDQMTTSEQSKKIIDTTPEEIPSRSLSFHHVTNPGYEKQTEHGSLPKHVGSYPVMVSGPTPTAEEKNSGLPPTEKQLRLQEGDKFAAMQHVILVPSQHMTPPVCSSSMSIHSVANTSGMVTMATSFPPSFPMGTFMVPAGGIVVAQPGPLANQAVSTVTDHQSLGKPVSQVAQGQIDVRQTGLQIMPQVMVSSTLTPQMNKLNISNATSQQLQKAVIADNSVVRKDQNIQTDGTETLQQDRAMTTSAQSNTGLSVGYSSNTVSAPQGGFKYKSPTDQSRQSYDGKTVSSQVMDNRAGGSTVASMAATAAADRHQYRPVVISDHESVSSDQTDSGIETTDNTREAMSQVGELYLEVVKKENLMQNQMKLNQVEWTRPEIEEGAGLSLLTAAVEIREQKSIVEEICPKSSSVRGGSKFILILNEHLPADLEVFYAYFGNSEPVKLNKVNEVNLSGIVPAYHMPCSVTVKLMSSKNSCLGKTSFDYKEEINVDFVLRQLVHDPDLQSRFFSYWAQGLRQETTQSGNRHPSQPPSNIKTASSRLYQLVLRLCGRDPELARRFFLSWAQGRGNGTSEKNELTESNYDADDEDSSSDSSEDVVTFCNKDGHLNSESLPSNVSITFSKEMEAGASEWEFPRSKHTEEQSNLQLAFQTIVKRGNMYNNQKANGQMTFLAFRDLMYNNPNTSMNENLDNLPFHGPESEARIVELDTSACPNKREEEMNGASCDNRTDVPDNRRARSNNTENTGIIDNERNYVDLDQNSVADKTRRAEEFRSSTETGDSPADPL